MRLIHNARSILILQVIGCPVLLIPKDLGVAFRQVCLLGLVHDNFDLGRLQRKRTSQRVTLRGQRELLGPSRRPQRHRLAPRIALDRAVPHCHRVERFGETLAHPTHTRSCWILVRDPHIDPFTLRPAPVGPVLAGVLARALGDEPQPMHADLADLIAFPKLAVAILDLAAPRNAPNLFGERVQARAPAHGGEQVQFRVGGARRDLLAKHLEPLAAPQLLGEALLRFRTFFNSLSHRPPLIAAPPPCYTPATVGSREPPATLSQSRSAALEWPQPPRAHTPLHRRQSTSSDRIGVHRNKLDFACCASRYQIHTGRVCRTDRTEAPVSVLSRRRPVPAPAATPRRWRRPPPPRATGVPRRRRCRPRCRRPPAPRS